MNIFKEIISGNKYALSKGITLLESSLEKDKIKAKKLIKKCLSLGFSTPIIVNASNEVLVGLFLKGKIGFLDIVSTINKIFKDKEF